MLGMGKGRRTAGVSVAVRQGGLGPGEERSTGNVAGTAWQNFHTGVRPGKHGHYEGVKHFDPASYEDGVYFTERFPIAR